MKELSIEEKARAYDEAKARMSKAFNSNRCTISFMNEIFPELKQSEDEKIKHEIKVILANTDLSQFALDYTFADMLNWLEKQGKLMEYYEDKLDRCACENFNKGYKAAMNKQGEQNPA